MTIANYNDMYHVYNFCDFVCMYGCEFSVVLVV